tara:strand:- start:2252 stop:2734 length:483 start_codon:yes stop_codon:yes gene_type:complete
MFKKMKDYRNAFQQGRLDSLADNAYLNIVVLISLIFNLKKLTVQQKEKMFRDIIDVVINYNLEFKELKLSIEEINNIYKSFNLQLLEEALNSYKDVYTPGGSSYTVLKNEYKLTDREILNIKNAYHNQITSTLKNLSTLNSELISEKYLLEHLDIIYSKL